MSSGELITPELIEFSRQLGVMNTFLIKYREQHEDIGDTIGGDIIELESHLSGAAYHLGALVAMEFQEKTFYKKD